MDTTFDLRLASLQLFSVLPRRNAVGRVGLDLGKRGHWVVDEGGAIPLRTEGAVHLRRLALLVVRNRLWQESFEEALHVFGLGAIVLRERLEQYTRGGKSS